MGPSKLDEILKDKRVALVGNATSLLDHDLGEEIDSYDVVIRMNRVVENLDPKKQGKRTDVLFFARPIGNFNQIDFQLAIWTCAPSEFTMRHSGYNISDDKMDKLEFFPQDQRMYMKHCMFEGCFPTTGFIAVQHTIFRDYKEMWMFGFDGFKTGSIVTGQNNSWKWHRPDLEEIEINNMIERNTYLRGRSWLSTSTDSQTLTQPKDS